MGILQSNQISLSSTDAVPCTGLLRRIPTASKPQGGNVWEDSWIYLDAVLQCSDWESFHNSPGFLSLYHHLLAKSNPFAGFPRGFHPSFDHAQTRDRKFTNVLDFFGGDSSQAIDHLREDTRFHLELSCKSICNRTLGHGLCSSLHRLHRLHGSHGDY